MTTSALSRAESTPPKSDHRWLVLVVVSIAQLMVVLDATVVNIALPSAQAALGFDNSQRQWIITAYALAFGSLLLLGGRVGDIVGRKRTFAASPSTRPTRAECCPRSSSWAWPWAWSWHRR